MTGDPYAIKARKSGSCNHCGKPFPPGVQIVWWPRTRRATGPCCADAAYARFRLEAADEDIFRG